VTKLERALANTEDEQGRRELEAELVAARNQSDTLQQRLREHSSA
jgi:hypothetical protein